MESEIKKLFINFCGEEKYSKFKDKLSRISHDEYDLLYWQESLLNKFIDANKLSLSKEKILDAVADGTEFIYHCPSDACAYVAICIDWKKDEWSCGECGTEWSSRASLFNSIEESIKKHRYREALYKRTNSGFEPVSRADYPENIDILIEDEEIF